MDIKELLQETCDRYDYNYMNDYSGRFMYGKICVGVVFPQGTSLVEGVLNVIKVADENEMIDEDLLRQLSHGVTDNMGLGTIWYFPAIAGEYESPDAI